MSQQRGAAIAYRDDVAAARRRVERLEQEVRDLAASFQTGDPQILSRRRRVFVVAKGALVATSAVMAAFPVWEFFSGAPRANVFGAIWMVASAAYVARLVWIHVAQLARSDPELLTRIRQTALSRSARPNAAVDVGADRSERSSPRPGWPLALAAALFVGIFVILFTHDAWLLNHTTLPAVLLGVFQAMSAIGAVVMAGAWFGHRHARRRIEASIFEASDSGGVRVPATRVLATPMTDDDVDDELADESAPAQRRMSVGP